MPPLVSIALSTYNGERFLREQLDSLLAQRGVDIEIVAVDDGSSDGTPALLQEYAMRDRRLRWRSNPANLGPTRSFERALSLCEGEFLAPCDQDDIWHPDKLRTLLSTIGDADLAYCDSAYIDCAGAPFGHCVSTDMAMMSGRTPLAFLFSNSVSGHASLVRRSLFQAARPLPDGLYHDWWLALCAAGRGGVVYVDRPLVSFRRHEAAFSDMGPCSGPRMGKASESRTWLEDRLRLTRAYAAMGLRDGARAGALATALDTALGGGTLRGLVRALWRCRAAAPRWTGQPTLDWIKLLVRFLRKLRRARRVPGNAAALPG